MQTIHVHCWWATLVTAVVLAVPPGSVDITADISALRSDNRDTQLLAAERLVAQGAAAVRPLVDELALPEKHGVVEDILVQIGSVALNDLKRGCSSRSQKVRRNCYVISLRILASSRDEEGFCSIFAAAASDRDPLISTTVFAEVENGIVPTAWNRSCATIVLRHLKTSRSNFMAVRALGFLSSDDIPTNAAVAEQLAILLGDDDSHLRSQAVDSICRMRANAAAAIPALLELAVNDTLEIRRDAIRAIAGTGARGGAVEEVLCGAIEEGDVISTYAALDGLIAIRHLADEATKRLRTAFRDKKCDELIQYELAYAIAVIDPDVTWRRKAYLQLAACASSDEEDPAIRMQAIERIGRLESFASTSLPRLRKIASRAGVEPAIREESVRAIQRLERMNESILY